MILAGSVNPNPNLNPNPNPNLNQAVSVILVGSVKPALLATNATLLGGSTNISATETYSVADMEDEASAANVGAHILALCRALCRALYAGPLPSHVPIALSLALNQPLSLPPTVTLATPPLPQPEP